MEEISDRIFVKLNDVTYIKFRRYKEKNILVKYSAIRASIHDKNNQGHWFECFEAFSFNIFTPINHYPCSFNIMIYSNACKVNAFFEIFYLYSDY